MDSPFGAEAHRPTVIWTTADGVRCAIARYDETRYQLRLFRREGTIKADLFASLAEALTTAERWREERPD